MKTTRPSLTLSIVLLLPLFAGCSTLNGVGSDARKLFTGTLGKEELEVCSKEAMTTKDGESTRLDGMSFEVGKSGEGCQDKVGMAVSSSFLKLFSKVNGLTVGDIVTLSSIQGVGDGLRILQKLTVRRRVKRSPSLFPNNSSRAVPSQLAPASARQSNVAQPRAVLGAVRGAVTDETGQPLKGVWIAVNGDSVITGPDGRYFLAIPPGSHEVRVFAHGFQDLILTDVRIEAGQTNEIPLFLTAVQTNP